VPVSRIAGATCVSLLHADDGSAAVMAQRATAHSHCREPLVGRMEYLREFEHIMRRARPWPSALEPLKAGWSSRQGGRYRATEGLLTAGGMALSSGPGGIIERQRQREGLSGHGVSPGPTPGSAPGHQMKALPSQAASVARRTRQASFQSACRSGRRSTQFASMGCEMRPSSMAAAAAPRSP
jgi:hypothetical protein